LKVKQREAAFPGEFDSGGRQRDAAEIYSI
jgi:hypothetical protein